MRRDAKKLRLGGRNIIEEVKEKKERRNKQKKELKRCPKNWNVGKPKGTLRGIARPTFECFDTWPRPGQQCHVSLNVSRTEF